MFFQILFLVVTCQMCLLLVVTLFLFSFFILKSNLIALVLFLSFIGLLACHTEFLDEIFQRNHVRSVVQTKRHVLEDSEEQKVSDQFD